MSKTVCFRIFAVSLAVILAAYVANIGIITKEVGAIFTEMQNIYVALSAVILSLLMTKTKHYWLIMLGVAVLAAGIIQAVVAGSTLLSIALLYKIIAFIIYVYFVALIRYMW